MFPRFHRLNWLKSRTFWQVALALTVTTALQPINKTTTFNNDPYLNNYLENSQPNSFYN